MLSLVDRQVDVQYAAEEDLNEVAVVRAPHDGQIARTIEMCEVFVGLINAELAKLPKEQQVIIVDGEWAIGHMKMDLLSICLPFSNYDIKLFQLSTMCNGNVDNLPRMLKVLLEDNSVKKVGNRINSDVFKLKGWGVDLKPTVELGHLLYDRALVSSKAPSLETIIDVLFPGVELEGKQGGFDTPRISNWAARDLSEKQKRYAFDDAYSTAVSYRRCHQIMDPKVQGRLHVDDLVEGLTVTLYNNGWKGRVAEGTICMPPRTRKNKVTIEIDIGAESSLYSPGTYVDVIQADNTTTRQTIAHLQDQFSSDNENLTIKTVRVEWPLFYCRKTINMSGSESKITIHTEKKQVITDNHQEDSLYHQNQNYDADNEGESRHDTLDSTSSSSDGENDKIARLPLARRRRMNHYRREKVKNDIAHIFFRYEKVLSKEHGAYFDFMTAMRDAFYVLNQSDLDECYQALREQHNYTDRDIWMKLKYNFDWFQKRVRRHVPDPPTLEKRYMEVYEQYKDIRCVKSGKKLFPNKKTHAAHLSALKHIRRNCLSDVPFVSYYTPSRRDKNGLVVYQCHRGTPGNEGLHQKLRQLVRGFSNSPRLMHAILTDFFLAWNHNIDIKLRGLPARYEGLYCGDLLETEIDKMAAWRQRDAPPHPDWVSTRSVQCSGESFGFLVGDDGQDRTNEDDDSSCDEVIEAAENLISLEDQTNTEEAMITNLPASSQWMASLHGKFRPHGRVLGNVEWEYFKTNVSNFQGVADDEADNYSSIGFSAFAESWNKWVDSLGTKYPTVTYKTAAYLRDAYKSMKRRAIQVSTLRPYTDSLNDLRVRHTNKEMNEMFLAEFPDAEPAPTIQPAIDTAQASINIGDDDSIADMNDYNPEISLNNKVKRSKKRSRCRMCGKCYASPEWLPYHTNKIPNKEDWSDRRASSRHLRNMVPENKVWEVCTVPRNEYEPNFPCLDLKKPMPRIAKKRAHDSDE